MSSNHIPCETSSRETAAKTIRSVHPPRTGFVKTTIVVVLALLATGIASMTLLKSSREDPLAVTNNAITFEAFKDTFVSSINEVGDIESNGKIWVRGNRLGSIEPNGEVWFRGNSIGSLEDNGEVWRGGTQVGLIDKAGKAWIGGNADGEITPYQGEWKRAAVLYYFRDVFADAL